MDLVKIYEWGNCRICGEYQHLRFGVCGGDCVEVWKSQGKWEWDKNNPELANLSCSGHKWNYKETRPVFIREGEL